MDCTQLPPHEEATYVLPHYKLVYVALPKTACTSVKWMLSDLAGEEADRFHGSLSREVTQVTTIHRRGLWRRTPTLHALSADQLGEITDDNGWMSFAVTRHPAARMWSAWQSKLLLREPLYMDRFGSADWLPRVPTSTGDLVEDFQRFVASVAADPDHGILQDRHFMPQVRLLNFGVTPYTRVYDTSELPSLLRALEAHLRGLGWDGTLRLVRSNEMPLQPLRLAFPDDVVSAIAGLYADDMKAFGYDDARPPKLLDTAEYPKVALEAVGMLIERAERIGKLAMHAQRLSRAVKATRGKLKTARGERETTLETLETTRQDLTSAHQELKTVRAEHKTARAELKTVRKELKATRETLKTTRETLKTTRETLKTTREALRNSRGPARRLASALARRFPVLLAARDRVRGAKAGAWWLYGPRMRKPTE